MDLSFAQFGLGAGGLFWVGSGLLVFVPLWLDLAYPYWGRKGERQLRKFTVRSLLCVCCATLPGGIAIAAAVLVREHRGGGLQFISDEPEAEPAPGDAPPAPVVLGEPLPAAATPAPGAHPAAVSEGCR